MRWRQLTAFRETMITGTASGAADIMGISQPAVSRLIDALEESVGITLFDRRTGRMVPTVEARIFFAELEKTFAGYDKLVATAQDIKQGRKGSLHIASMPALGLNFLPDALTEFSRLQPDVKIRYDLQLSMRVEEWVSSQQVDLGLAEFPFQRAGIEREEFCELPYVMALPQDHPLTAEPVIRPGDLHGVRMVSLSAETVARRLMVACLADAGATPQVVCETTYAAGVCALVQRGQGVGLVDPFTASDFAGQGVVFRRFEPELTFHVGILYPRHQPRSRTAGEFLRVLRARRNGLVRKIDALLAV
ncbi:LysR family transcriptional regulator [Roseovarius spongiae]|uniref:LysR family transcriptional regulator n=1 Tax=Roseovarius spongiae TaxID=2320272 RepID=A0A3A8B2T5_9RHOB|nr:LysR substrate-binding domain-containing protein [Roseovarius spongiae]RKF14175.1 LysR family transcriptional regulator [Roseovarius spongiae]